MTEEAPPPSYNEAVNLLRDTTSLSTSDPSIDRRTGNDQSQLPSKAGGSQQYLPRGGADLSNVSISPHSSDDEETATIKAELRRLRAQEHSEYKKAFLRQMLDEERRAVAAMSASNRGGSSQFLPPAALHTYHGTTPQSISNQETAPQARPQPTAPPLSTDMSVEMPNPSPNPNSPNASGAQNKKRSGSTTCVMMFVGAAVVVFPVVIIILFIII